MTAGYGPGGGLWNKLVATPGQALYLGESGGVLLLAPPGESPGAMPLYTMQCRVLYLLRENGPDTGYPLPTTGDYTAAVIQRDLNIALAGFISETGIAPDIADRMDVLPVFPVLDYPVPPGLVSLTRIEYTPVGQQTYALIGYSLTEFDNAIGIMISNDVGQPTCFRQPFAGYIRLQPQPGPGNATGPGTGIITLGGAPVAGQTIHATLVYGALTVTTLPYTVLNTDTTSSIAFKLASSINVSAAVTGANAFLQPPSTNQNVITLTALAAPGTGITYATTMTGTGLTSSPSAATTLSPTGDTMTFYYSSMGNVMVNPGDTPGIPAMFHNALVYRVLADYWERKQDGAQADRYLRKYEKLVEKGKSLTFDINRSTQPSIAGGEWDDDNAFLPGGW